MAFNPMSDAGRVQDGKDKAGRMTETAPTVQQSPWEVYRAGRPFKKCVVCDTMLGPAWPSARCANCERALDHSQSGGKNPYFNDNDGDDTDMITGNR